MKLQNTQWSNSRLSCVWVKTQELKTQDVKTMCIMLDLIAVFPNQFGADNRLRSTVDLEATNEQNKKMHLFRFTCAPRALAPSSDRFYSRRTASSVYVHNKRRQTNKWNRPTTATMRLLCAEPREKKKRKQINHKKCIVWPSFAYHSIQYHSSYVCAFFFLHFGQYY